MMTEYLRKPSPAVVIGVLRVHFEQVFQLMCQNADRMADSAEPDQTADLKLVLIIMTLRSAMLH